MKKLFQLPELLPTARIPLLFSGVWLLLFTMLRLMLTAMTGSDAVEPTYWPGILLKGLIFDAATLAVLVAPVMIYEALLPTRWRLAKWHRVARLLWFGTAFTMMLVGTVAELIFWSEFSTRFNFIAVDYLIYTHEVLANVWQSYPVIPTILVLTLVGAALALLLRNALRRADQSALRRSNRLGYGVMGLALPALALSAMSLDQFDSSGNAYADELAVNGLYSFAAAMRRNELDYDRFYLTIPQEQADTILSRFGVERRTLSEIRATQGTGNQGADESDDALPMTRRPKNIVLISVESLSASFMGSYGAKDSLTPRLDRLAFEGLRFSHVYATGTRTVRGLEALSLGTPPVPGQAIVRRPRNEHLQSLGEIIGPQGVKTYFFYGGYGYFDNMSGYFGTNSYTVIDRTDIPASEVHFENAWGVADEVLFDHSITTLNAQAKSGAPFFAHIMTTSNHRPYTYPPDRIDIPSPGGRSGAVKYTDYAIGKFIDDARVEPWFEQTLFIIVADHCASAAGKSTLALEGYRIPLIFYAPGFLPAGTSDGVISQIDIVPTIVEMLGVRGDDHFFGRSIFEAGPAPGRAFVSNYQALGYLRRDILTVLLPRKKAESYVIDPNTQVATPAAVDPELLAEAIAYYQTASRSFKEGALRMASGKVLTYAR